MSIIAGAMFGRIADAMKDNREYMKKKHELLQTYFMNTGFEDLKKANDARKLRSARVAMAEGLGLSKAAASVLETSGQLELEIERLAELNKKGELDKSQLKKISEFIVESLPEEKVTAAIKYVTSGDLSFSKPGSASETAIAAMYNATDDQEFMEAAFNFSTSVRDEPTIKLGPIDYTTRSADIITLSDRRAAYNNLASSIGGYLGTGIVEDAQGNFLSFQGESPENSQAILNNAYNVYENIYKSAGALENPSEIINKIGNNVRVLKESGQDLDQIASNPSFDVNFKPKPVVIDPEASAAKDAMTLGGFTEKDYEENFFNKNRLNKE
jgi:hypothetical protein